MLPEVKSSRRLPLPRSPFASAVRIMFSAGLSLTEPPGLNHSALAKICIRGDRFEVYVRAKREKRRVSNVSGKSIQRDRIRLS